MLIKIIFISLFIIGIIIVITLGIIHYKKRTKCWPFKYGGFTHENGYNDPG